MTHWVDSYNIWIIPQVNLDGINYVFNNYDMWRKDRHSPPPGYSDYGIDPNRNYPAFWGACGGSSGSPGSDLYRGQFPGESYCVSRIMTLASAIKPVFNISYHSYSELVIYPYGCDNAYTPDKAAMASVGQGLASVLMRITARWATPQAPAGKSCMPLTAAILTGFMPEPGNISLCHRGQFVQSRVFARLQPMV